MDNFVDDLRADKFKYRDYLAVLIVIYLITHLVILTLVPFLADEGPYSIMIEEQITHPSLVVTFFGYEVGWKPPLFFWVYGLFVPLLRSLPISIESVYRLPGTLFGLINVVLIFFIFDKIIGSKKEAFFVALLYSTTFLIINTDSRVLTDTLCGTMVFAGMLAYLHGSSNRKLFLLGGFFTILAYFVKQLNAGVIPVVATAFLLQKNRKKLFDPIFLISLIGFPIGWWLYNISVSHLTMTYDFNSYVTNIIIGRNLNFQAVASSIFTFFIFAGVWLMMSIIGFLKNWRISYAISFWYLLSIFPLIAGTYMPWYFYPVIPSIAFFSFQLLYRDENGKGKEDNFFFIVFILIITAGLIIGLLAHLSYYDETIIQKRAGEYLVGKDNVFIIGRYAPGIFAYKILEEKRANGNWKDFGLIILSNNSAQEYYKFLKDYHHNDSAVIDGNFMDLFWRSAIFRRNTSITKFDYIVISGNNTVNPGGSMVFNDSDIQIFKVR